MSTRSACHQNSKRELHKKNAQPDCISVSSLKTRRKTSSRTTSRPSCKRCYKPHELICIEITYDPFYALEFVKTFVRYDDPFFRDIISKDAFAAAEYAVLFMDRRWPSYTERQILKENNQYTEQYKRKFKL